MVKKITKSFRIVMIAAAMIVGAAFTVLADETTFVSGTSLNGLGISGMTVEEATERIRNFYSSEYKLVVKARSGSQEVLLGTDIGFTVTVPDGMLQEILDTQNAGGRLSGPDIDNKHRVEMQNTYSEEALRDKVYGLNCISGTNIVTTTDAHISAYQEGQPFVIVPEVIGNNVNPDNVEAVIRQAVISGDKEIDLDANGCYYQVQITSGDETLIALCDTMNQCREMTVTYVFGDVEEVLESATICTWITGAENGQITLNRDSVAAYVSALAGKYNTAGTTRVFHTATGRDVELKGSYGWTINQQAETDALYAVIQTAQSQSREPIYSASAASRSGQDWGITYVEVDLTGQHVYMVKDGTVVWDASCVTGNLAKGNDTPAGIYSLAYKQRDKVLRGAKQADGTYEYESPVSYWMPFNGGIGLHDANWRSKFGGTIYKTNGSHGCINLPPSQTGALYELVYAGIPVLCYQ
ncbi:MAG: L,D-transpeptidase family protein [Lachnospiraceae bacterium]